MKTRSTLRFVLEGVEGAALLVAVVVTWPLSRRWLVDWGSRRAERERHWPGDELIPERVRTATRAITIAAPATTVWKWILQFGLGKAGFYSYELLERLGGIPVVNVETLDPAWQSLAVGDEILLHPEAGVRVAAIEEGRSLRFGKRTALGEDVTDASWSFYLEAPSDETCRLVVRSCFAAPEDTRLAKRLARGVEAALDCVMERRMLRTLKRLSEAT